MIVIDEKTYETVMRVLRDATHPERQSALNQMRIAMMDGITRELKYANSTPALLKRQAH